jgi:hypothetical protein
MAGLAVMAGLAIGINKSKIGHEILINQRAEISFS